MGTSTLEERLQRAWTSRGAVAIALLPAAALFGLVTALRRALFRLGWTKTATLGVPVIVVGNIVVGGAGKTPTVIALVELLRAHGYTPGVVSRGYGRESSGVLDVARDTPPSQGGDEPVLIRRRSDAPVVVGRDRVAAARELLERHPKVDVVVSDDGLQHGRLPRDAQVLVFDERGAGNGWLLPAGPLREPLPESPPPRSLVVYNAAASTTPLRGTLVVRSIARASLLADWLRGDASGDVALDTLRGRALVAAAGLAQPDRFFRMLRDVGLEITELALPDHHGYATLPWPADTRDVIVTEKDAVKLDPDRVGDTRVWVAPLDFDLGPDFAAALLALIPRPRDGNTPA